MQIDKYFKPDSGVIHGGSRIPEEWRILVNAELGQAEAVEIVNRIGSRLHAPTDWPFGAAGLDRFFADDDSPLGKWRTICLGSPGNGRGRIVFMDSTTLFTVMKLISGEDPRLATPLALLDMATFLNSLVLYDQICFLENRHLQLTELEGLFGGDIFKELPVASTVDPTSDYFPLGDIREQLVALYKFRTVPWLNDVRVGRKCTGPERRAWVKAWETILHMPCSPEWLLRDPNEGYSEYMDTWNTPTAELFADITDVMTEQLKLTDNGVTRRNPSTGPVFVAQQSNARALANIHIAETLRVPYAGSVARLPILHVLMRTNRSNLADLIRIPRAAEAVDEVFREDVLNLVRSRPKTIPLPFFASSVLQRAKTPAEIPEIALSIREKSKRFRDDIDRLNSVFGRTDSVARKETRLLRKALSDPTRWDKVELVAVAGELTAGAAGQMCSSWSDPVQRTIALATLILSGLVVEATRRRILECSRPQFRMLRKFDVMEDSAPAVEHLWNVPNITDWGTRMRELSSLATGLS